MAVHLGAPGVVGGRETRRGSRRHQRRHRPGLAPAWLVV